MIVNGSVNRDLAMAIAQHMNVGVGKCRVARFPDTEVNVQLDDRFATLTSSSSSHLVRLWTSAQWKHLPLPMHVAGPLHHPSRGSRRISAMPGAKTARPAHGPDGRLVADFAEHAGVNHVIAVDLHSPQVEGFFHVPVENLTAMPVISDAVKRDMEPGSVIVSPDTGGIKLASATLPAWAARWRFFIKSD